MGRAILVASLVGAAAVTMVLPCPVSADKLSVGVQTTSESLGIQMEGTPTVTAVRGTRVYHAPKLPYNYFAYRHTHYLFYHGTWFSAENHDGPWTVIPLKRVPPAILGIPVTYYKNPPGHWKKRGRPPWAEANGRTEAREHAEGKKPEDKEDDG